jgi:hypothetical protein
MKLHENITIFRDAIRVTAQQKKLQPEYIEKDYWVTYALFKVFNSEVGAHTVFKGGTALAKCYNLIERFSEDIDLVVLRHEDESNNRLKGKLQAISTVVEIILPEVEIQGITRKMGMNRKTAHTYNKEFIGDYGQVRDIIVLESTWLGYYEPFTSKSIVSFVGQMMIDNSQADIAEANGLLPFIVSVLKPERTICEKIMSLVRFSYGENPIEDLRSKIRHTYDLHQLLIQEEFSTFLNSAAFDEMLLKVANDDVHSFRNNNSWLLHHPNEALIFRDLDSIWNELKVAYNGGFRNMVYGAFPNEAAIFATLKMLQDRLKTISWTIQV